MKLFWDIRNTYDYNGISYMEVPFTGLNNMVTYPTHTLVFWKKENGLKSVATASPVTSAIKNDGDLNDKHEYNASYSYGPISAAAFATLQATITSESQHMYDLDNYNCSHFATNVINSILEPYQRIEPLGWPAIHPITHQPLYFSNSPSGLYNKFEQMKTNGTWTAYRIVLGIKEYGKASNGECN